MKSSISLVYDPYLVALLGQSVTCLAIDELEWGYLKQRLLWYRFRTTPKRIETVNQQRFKKLLLELVFQGARLVIPTLTFPMVEGIVHGFGDNSLTSDRTQMVLSLNRASDYLFETDDYGIELLRGINFFVSAHESEAWGVLRDPSDESKLEGILNTELSIVDDAVRLIFSLVEAQPFFGGNVRTVYLYVSKVWFVLSGEVMKFDPDSFKKTYDAYIEGRLAMEEVYYCDLRCTSLD